MEGDGMKIYMCSRFQRREEMARYAVFLRGLGIEITSRWHDNHTDASALQRYAQECYADVKAADIVLAFAENPSRSPEHNTGGRHVEVGLAIAWGKRVILVAYQENVFHYMPEMELCSDWPTAAAFLESEWRKEKSRTVVGGGFDRDIATAKAVGS
jgi:hypothetical protein